MDFEMDEGQVKVIEGKVFVDLESVASSIHLVSHSLGEIPLPEIQLTAAAYHALWNAMMDYHDEIVSTFLNDKLENSPDQ